ncbi:hypothetical protein PHYBLDRAFT_174502 [Phycomyces blakesleeanus NRRL 1555(-)]|uniref:Uncharacterized protein n=1 Tax=Phycomyces blakesleeanus (strain ATCC 8743b / DSM 1359 / FGSC 10004 / NBRC 33097 / NRRL 1555) TaxID=763407 RepID=A0A167K2C7_PHYB8|nr:hypothetical protein PHYBLDRAFT_174502 [Phycomyces blakesleeanus NRRL 1555(-)]OAD67118.1 hypothetical protein PHYBLDRAFT_174502 [Phycomyces blakesleeanus NRRL 1555(-)]|eukprot:XP_018285158.1 hypothetical protein PHYBLDRAFT_174502 [Phycomyces blakesleeanus NRRL 1555(-)]
MINSASAHFDIVNELLYFSSSVSIIYPELNFQYYDSNVSINSDTDEDNAQDYKSNIDKFENILSGDIYIFAKEEEDYKAEDNKNLLIDINKMFLLNTILPLLRSFANQLSSRASETVEMNIHKLKLLDWQLDKELPEWSLAVIYNDNYNAIISDLFISLNTNFATMTCPYLMPIETITSIMRKDLCF